MTFTQRRNLNENKGVKMYEQIKNLGVSLDTRLTYKLYFEMIANKAIRPLWTYRRYVGGTWGLKLKMLL